jgi:hypothetical protein
VKKEMPQAASTGGVEMEETRRQQTLKKYVALVSLIGAIENRLMWSEVICLLMNLLVFLFTVNYAAPLTRGFDSVFTPLSLVFILFSLVIGMSISAYSAAFSLRLHLKLKLHCFQARSLERVMNSAGESIYSDASIFFDPNIRRLNSGDGQESIFYPISGVTRMDGFIGSAKPQHFSWLMPSLFFIIYAITFVWVCVRFIES